MPEPIHGYLAMCQLFNPVQIYEFDTFYPDHLGLKDPEKDWGIYAEKIKSIVSKALDVPSTEFGFRDYKEYA